MDYPLLLVSGKKITTFDTLFRDVVLTPTTVGINTILGQKDSTLQQNH